ncbi:MAG TPA: SBBP repeat-containing protein [Terriglobales bacterium]|nr:SBBP repeat-containing protein [Terriglobales bacterium]
MSKRTAKTASKKTSSNPVKAGYLAMTVFAAAISASYFATLAHASTGPSAQAASGKAPASSPASKSKSTSQLPISSTPPIKSISLPLFFEPNQGQTAPQVKFLARGHGYGLFLTADEAVLQLQRSTPSTQQSAGESAVIRMHLDGADASASVSGTDKLPGRSNYFIGNDPSKWHHDIPQFGRVEYNGVYPGVNLVYYGDHGQLEYDFRIAPAADPSQIALSFTGASAHVDPQSGDLLLTTGHGDVRFHAPHVYQKNGSSEKSIAGSFRELADNKIGFKVGPYDHRRELVIDPVLTYSTYFGGSGTESFVNVTVDTAGLIYLVGSTTPATDFPFPLAGPATIAPFQGQPQPGPQNVFIAVINPFAPQQNNPQLLYATYLGGSGTDFPAGIAVSTNIDPLTTGIDLIVAGSTTSIDFPVDGALAAFQSSPPAQPGGGHGFVTRLNLGSSVTTLRYSTYLWGTNATGDATDIVTGLAIDGQSDAFVTGTTTSTNGSNNNGLTGFPANANGFQTLSNAPLNNSNVQVGTQFFASKINTAGSGPQSMIYSTYLGGGNQPAGPKNIGGGIAVDTAGNMYITGGTNYLGTVGTDGQASFPLNNAYQSCLNESGQTICPTDASSNLDAFIAKISPTPGFTLPIYCTYLGGGPLNGNPGDDFGTAIAVDSNNSAYITGSTTSSDWASSGSGFQTQYKGNGDAFIAKIGGNPTGTIYPLDYFSYLGGSGTDSGAAIQVNGLQTVFVAGSTNSTDFPITLLNKVQPVYGGAGDAFVASISTTGGTQGAYSTYLGGSGLDQATGIAIDVFGDTYVAGTTQSTNFPTVNPFQATLDQGVGNLPDAFVSNIGPDSVLVVTPASTSPSPNPINAGSAVTFTFNIANNGPDNATHIIFTIGNLPTSGGQNGLSGSPTATTTAAGGTCNPVQGMTITCSIPTLAAGAQTTVTTTMTPIITTTAKQISGITGVAIANNIPTQYICLPAQPPANIANFTVSASTTTPVINAGDVATIQVVFTPTNQFGYNAPITPGQTISPSMVTATTPTFTPTPVTPGAAAASTTLTIATVARPVTTGSLLHRSSFYATWLPITGVSLAGLGIGVGRKRRRWLAGIALCVIAGAMLLQSGCGSASSPATQTGGTLAGVYTVTVSGSPGSSGSQTVKIFITVN